MRSSLSTTDLKPSTLNYCCWALPNSTIDMLPMPHNLVTEVRIQRICVLGAAAGCVGCVCVHMRLCGHKLSVCGSCANDCGIYMQMQMQMQTRTSNLPKRRDSTSGEVLSRTRVIEICQEYASHKLCAPRCFASFRAPPRNSAFFFSCLRT